MAETTTTTSADGCWELWRIDNFVQNAEGYGNGDWRIELVERASGRVSKQWNGRANTSPWDASSSGVSSVRWEGTELVVVEDDVETRDRPS